MGVHIWIVRVVGQHVRRKLRHPANEWVVTHALALSPMEILKGHLYWFEQREIQGAFKLAILLDEALVLVDALLDHDACQIQRRVKFYYLLFAFLLFLLFWGCILFSLFFIKLFFLDLRRRFGGFDVLTRLFAIFNIWQAFHGIKLLGCGY